MKGRNQFTKAKDEGKTIPTVSSITRQKLSDAAKNQVWSATRRESHSVTMTNAVLSNPESYSSGSRAELARLLLAELNVGVNGKLTFISGQRMLG